MRRGPFIASVALHILITLALLLAGRQGEVKSKPLPEATVVKLVRPKPIPAVPPKTIPKDPKLPETAPPLKLPDKKKSEPKPKPVEQKKEAPKPRAKEQPPKELQGEAGTLKVQTPGFEYDFYLALIQSKIERNFRPPPGIRGQYLATVSFVISADGAMSSIDLIQTSGNSLIDRAAERAVRAAGRFPPLPSQYDKGELGINFEFVVNSAVGG